MTALRCLTEAIRFPTVNQVKLPLDTKTLSFYYYDTMSLIKNDNVIDVLILLQKLTVTTDHRLCTSKKDY